MSIFYYKKAGGKIYTRAANLQVGVGVSTAGQAGPTPRGLAHARDTV